MRRDADSKVDAVRRLPSFRGCTDRELAGLIELGDEVELAAGHVLMREGDTAAEAFLILSGEVSVRLCGAVVATVGPGETVGEMAMIDAGPRSATVVAETSVRALVFGRRQVHGLLGQAGPARAVGSILASRLRRADVELAGRRPAGGLGVVSDLVATAG